MRDSQEVITGVQLSMNKVEISEIKNSVTAFPLFQVPSTYSVTAGIVLKDGQTYVFDRRKLYLEKQGKHIKDYIVPEVSDMLEENNVHWFHFSTVNGQQVAELLSKTNLSTGVCEKPEHSKNITFGSTDEIHRYFQSSIHIKAIVYNHVPSKNSYNIVYNPYWEQENKRNEMELSLLYIFSKTSDIVLSESMKGFISSDAFASFSDVCDKMNNGKIIGLIDQYYSCTRNRHLRKVLEEYSKIRNNLENSYFWQSLENYSCQNLNYLSNKILKTYLYKVDAMINKKEEKEITSSDLKYFVEKVNKDYNRRKRLNNGQKTSTCLQDVNSVMVYTFPDWFLGHMRI
jgi:hypothetical protein